MSSVTKSRRLLALAASASLLSLAATAQETNGLPAGVIAKQGNVQVTMQDIDAYAQKIPEQERVGFFDSPARIQNVITNMLLQKQLAAEARAQNLDAQPLMKVEIEQAIDDALAREALTHYRKALKLPDLNALAQEYYLGHKSEFVTHGTITVKHVLVENKDRSDADAKARIEEVLTEARAHPETFDQLVEKYSDDPSKNDNHGVMEDAGSGKYVPPFVEAAKALKKPAEISPIVKTQFGYHILKLVERKPDVQRTFAQVHDELVEKLRGEYVDRETKDHINQLRGKPLDADPELVAQVRTRFLPKGGKLPSEVSQEQNEAALKQAQEKEKASH
jgi:parvulin-like peptidyl-prolyl isomerase